MHIPSARPVLPVTEGPLAGVWAPPPPLFTSPPSTSMYPDYRCWCLATTLGVLLWAWCDLWRLHVLWLEQLQLCPFYWNRLDFLSIKCTLSHTCTVGTCFKLFGLEKIEYISLIISKAFQIGSKWLPIWLLHHCHRLWLLYQCIVIRKPLGSATYALRNNQDLSWYQLFILPGSQMSWNCITMHDAII